MRCAKEFQRLQNAQEAKKPADNYINTNNLMNKTSDYAYEFLEIMSSRLNQSPTNNIDEMIFFSGVNGSMHMLKATYKRK